MTGVKCLLLWFRTSFEVSRRVPGCDSRRLDHNDGPRWSKDRGLKGRVASVHNLDTNDLPDPSNSGDDDGRSSTLEDGRQIGGNKVGCVPVSHPDSVGPVRSSTTLQCDPEIGGRGPQPTTRPAQGPRRLGTRLERDPDVADRRGPNIFPPHKSNRTDRASCSLSSRLHTVPDTVGLLLFPSCLLPRPPYLPSLRVGYCRRTRVCRNPCLVVRGTGERREEGHGPMTRTGDERPGPGRGSGPKSVPGPNQEGKYESRTKVVTPGSVSGV